MMSSHNIGIFRGGKMKSFIVLFVACIVAIMIFVFHYMDSTKSDADMAQIKENLRHYNHLMQNNIHKVSMNIEEDLSASSPEDRTPTIAIWGKDFVDEVNSTIPTQIDSKRINIENNTALLANLSSITIQETFPSLNISESTSSNDILSISPTNVTSTDMRIDPIVLDEVNTFSLNVIKKDLRLEFIGSSLLPSTFQRINQIYMQRITRQALNSYSQPSNPTKKSVVDSFYHALYDGDICRESFAMNVQQKLVLDALADMLTVNEGKLFIELTSVSILQSFSKAISASSSQTTSVLIQMDNIGSNAAECQDYQRPMNLLVGRSPGVTMDSEIQTVSCIQFIEDLSLLVEGLLPFEFENYLGHILCRCDFTLLPKDIVSNSFFSYWESLATLVQKSSESVDSNVCSLTVESSQQFAIKIKYHSFIVVERLSHNLTLNEISIDNTVSIISLANVLDYQLDEMSTQNIYSSLSMVGTDSGNNGTISYDIDEDFPNAILNKYLILHSEVHHVSKAKDLLFIDSPKSSQSATSSPTLAPVSPWLTSYEKIKNLTAANTTTESSTISDIDLLHRSRWSREYSGSNHRRRLASYRRSHKSESSGGVTSSSSRDDPHADSKQDRHSHDSTQSVVWSLPSLSLTTAESVTLGRYENIRDDWNKSASLNEAKKLKTKFSSTSLFSTNDNREELRNLQIRELAAFKRWMSVLSKDTNSEGSYKVSYIFGRQITLMSIKLAQKYLPNNGLVVSVVTDAEAINTHMRLIESRNLVNNLLCYNMFDINQLGGLIRAPERADQGIIQADIVISLMVQAMEKSLDNENGECDTRLLDEVFAYLFQIAREVYIEIPSPLLMKLVITLELKNSDCRYIYIDRYSTFESLLNATAIQYSKDTIINAMIVDPIPTNAENTNTDSSFKSTIWKVQINQNDAIYGSETTALEDTGANLHLGVSLYTTLNLGALNGLKALLFRLLIELPIWSLLQSEQSQLLPWNIFLSVSPKKNDASRFLTLQYHGRNVTGTSSNDNESNIGVSLGYDGVEGDRITSNIIFQAIADQFDHHNAELAQGKFSFVEHDSGYGYLSTKIAKRYPNATVISLERDIMKTKFHYDMITSSSIHNNAICSKGDENYIIYKNIFDSPELFRFQVKTRGLIDEFISSYPLPSAAGSIESKLSKATPSNWADITGQLLTTAITTFLVVPTAAQVSLAYYVVYGDISKTTNRQIFTKPYRPTDSDERLISDALEIILGSSTISESNIHDEMKQYFTNANDRNTILSHPVSEFKNFEEDWLLGSMNDDTNHSITQLHITTNRETSERTISVPIVRLDIRNMSRNCHHHYNYIQDGHTRTYSMHVEVDVDLTREVKDYFTTSTVPSIPSTIHLSELYVSNNGTGVKLYQTSETSEIPSINSFAVSPSPDSPFSKSYVLPPGYHPNQNSLLSVGIHRDKDSFFIPYVTIYGVTLISVLRMGLIPEQRELYFKHFLKLPLYEDMAPWNIVLMGSDVDYIDYDTKEFTFDVDIPKAYQIMSVLMNYKRTVEDFHKCGSKASTVYGLPYVSECVGKTKSSESLKCPDLKRPVPCGDGVCYSDYITCLRAMADKAEEIASLAFDGKV